MKKNSFELLDDGFVNLYEEWIFVRCFEWSAILVSEITGYRLFANINKKTGLIFLEIGVPKNKLDEIIKNLEIRWYYLITSIYRANNSFEKRLENIRQAREQIEVLRLYIRIIKDLKLIKLEKFADLNENIESLSK